MELSILLGIKICLIAIIGDTLLGMDVSLLFPEFDIREPLRFLQTAVLPRLLNCGRAGVLDQALYARYLFIVNGNYYC